MRRIRKAALGGPIVTLLIAVAAIAIAAVVIGMFWRMVPQQPVVDSSSASLYYIGDKWYLTFKVTNPTGKTIKFQNPPLELEGDKDLISINTLYDNEGNEVTQLKPGQSVIIKIVVTSDDIGGKDTYKAILHTDAGDVVFNVPVK